MWDLVTQVRGGPGSARLSSELNDLKGHFQPNDSMIVDLNKPGI